MLVHEDKLVLCDTIVVVIKGMLCAKIQPAKLQCAAGYYIAVQCIAAHVLLRQSPLGNQQQVLLCRSIENAGYRGLA